MKRFSTDRTRQGIGRKARSGNRIKPKSGRTRTIVVSAIIILVAVAASAYFYENSGGYVAPAPYKTLVSGNLTPQNPQNYTFSNVLFVSTTTRIAYSANANNGAYSIPLLPGTVYNVTVVIQMSDGHHFCVTGPPSISVAGTNQAADFTCLLYSTVGV